MRVGSSASLPSSSLKGCVLRLYLIAYSLHAAGQTLQSRRRAEENLAAVLALQPAQIQMGKASKHDRQTQRKLFDISTDRKVKSFIFPDGQTKLIFLTSSLYSKLSIINLWSVRSISDLWTVTPKFLVAPSERESLAQSTPAQQSN